MMNSSGGKGSGRRPSQVSREEVDNNWDRIFGKKEEIERDYQNVWVEGETRSTLVLKYRTIGTSLN